ncbi:hypothetical protein [Nocardiopsis alba]|uniref:hypothetical protein n=1 Tax=Nocardiopsis alba TaxID=53437 RepID=UPI003634BA1E
MSRHEGRGPLFSILALSIGLALAGCSSSEPETEPNTDPTSELVSAFWIERQVRVVTLDRMFAEGDPDEIVENIGEERERLFESRIVQETDDGYVVELDEDAWDTTVGFSRIDNALNDAMYRNEVTWCEDDVTGEEFVDAYMDEHQGAFDTHDAYEASVADHVDCGTGRL